MSKQLIPQQFIDDLLHRIDIAEIISSRVKLKRAGSNLLGLCPFHVEKTPSFTVSPSKQFYHCFGCGAHGSAIGFIMQFEHLSFVEAVENLAAKTNLTVPKVSGYNDKIRFANLYDINNQAADFFEQQLPRSQRALSYLKSRGLSDTICKKFRVGYAPHDWDNLATIYKSSPLIKQHLHTAGLLNFKDNESYSRFRDRIMFPIFDSRNNIVGFGGRTLGKDLAKYLNSPETVIFHKGDELYGLNIVKKTSNCENILVVEGYMDVISLAQFGINNAVAALGTAISTKQIQLLLRNTSQIIFCFDGDNAGRKAAWRALENTLPLMRDGIQIRFLFLPETEDPDSLIRKEFKEKFVNRFASAITLDDFFFNQLTANINLTALDDRAKLAKTVQNYLEKMSRGVFHKLLLQRLAETIKMDLAELADSTTTTKETTQLAPPSPPPINIAVHPMIEKALILLLHDPQAIVNIDNIADLVNITLPGGTLLLKLINLLKEQPNLLTGAILEYYRETEEAAIFAKLATKEPLIVAGDLKNELIGIIQNIYQIEQEQLIQSYLKKAATTELSAAEKVALQKLIMVSKR